MEEKVKNASLEGFNILTLNYKDGMVVDFLYFEKQWWIMPLMFPVDNEDEIRFLNRMRVYCTHWQGDYPDTHLRR